MTERHQSAVISSTLTTRGDDQRVCVVDMSSTQATGPAAGRPGSGTTRRARLRRPRRQRASRQADRRESLQWTLAPSGDAASVRTAGQSRSSAQRAPSLTTVVPSQRSPERAEGHDDRGFRGRLGYVDDIDDALQITRPRRGSNPPSATSWTPFTRAPDTCRSATEHRARSAARWASVPERPLSVARSPTRLARRPW